MNYTRVIPRDLFNEANLLKCCGQLALHLLDYRYVTSPYFVEPNGGDGFQIVQDPDTGETMIANLEFWVDGRQWSLRRPLNSREPWPLVASCCECQDGIPVFASDGSISSEMRDLLKNGNPVEAL